MAVRVQEQVLPAGGATDGVDVTGVDFKACFAGGNTRKRVRIGQIEGDVGFNLLTEKWAISRFYT